MEHKEYCVVSGILFTLVAVAHLLRILYGVSVQVEEYDVPMFVSWIGLILPGALAVWAFRINRASE
jgi:hypothetical protein